DNLVSDARLCTATAETEVVDQHTMSDIFFEEVCALVSRRMQNINGAERMRCTLHNYILLHMELFPNADVEELKLRCVDPYTDHYSLNSFHMWFDSIIASIKGTK